MPISLPSRAGSVRIPRVLVCAPITLIPAATLEAAAGHCAIESVTNVGDLEAAADAAPPDVVLIAADVIDDAVLARVGGSCSLNGVPVVAVVAGSTGRLPDGVHDVLRAPIDTGELVARVRAAALTRALQMHVTASQRQPRIEASVTGNGLIYDRALIEDRLRKACSRTRRHGHGLAVIMLSVNDTGSFDPVTRLAVLEAFPKRLQRRLRAEDQIGWWDDDTLAVVAEDTDESGAAALTQALHDTICAAPVAGAGGPVALSASIGWTIWSDDSASTLAKRAFAAVRQARRTGAARHPVIGR